MVIGCRLVRHIDNYIKYSLDFLRPIKTAEAFEAVDWLADLSNKHGRSWMGLRLGEEETLSPHVSPFVAFIYLTPSTVHPQNFQTRQRCCLGVNIISR